MSKILIPTILLSLGLLGCNKAGNAPAPAVSAVTGPRATVTLKDGSNFSGVITANTPNDMTLRASNGEVRTYPMDDLLSVRYTDSIPPSDAVVGNPIPAPAPPRDQYATTQSQPQNSGTVSGMANEPRVTSAVSRPPVPYQSAPAPNYTPGQPVYRAGPLRPVEEFTTIPSGTTIQVRNNATISSRAAEAGQTFTAVVSRDVMDASGQVAIPRGSDATLVVVAAHDQGKLQGQSRLAVDLGGVTVGGRQYRLDTSDLVLRGKQGVGMNKRTGKFMGGGAALGGIIGAIAGGGVGAAIGAGAGAGAGLATQSLTRGKAVRIPSETLMSFRLEAPIRVSEIR